MIKVSAAILISDRNEILVCRRGPGGNCAGLWEFPGGKQEPGETPEDCLIRECREELGISIGALRLYEVSTFSYPDREIEFHFFTGRIVSGLPMLRVHTEMRWVSRRELSDFAFCPADQELLKKLQGDQMIHF